MNTLDTHQPLAGAVRRAVLRRLRPDVPLILHRRLPHALRQLGPDPGGRVRGVGQGARLLLLRATENKGIYST